MEVELVSRLKGHRSGVYKVFFTGYEDEFLSLGGDGWCVKWSMQNEEEGELVLKDDDNLLTGCMGNDQVVYAGSLQGNLLYADRESGLARKIVHHKKGLYDILVYEDKLMTVGGDGLFTIWDKERLRPLETVQVNEKGFRKICIDGDENLALAGRDGHLYRLNYKSRRVFDVVKHIHNGPVFSIVTSKDLNHFISCGLDAKINMVDKLTGNILHTVPAHMSTVNALSIHPSGQFVASAARDRTIKVWQTEDLKLLKVIDFGKFKGHEHSINSIDWDGDGHHLISGSDDRTVCLWKVSL